MHDMMTHAADFWMPRGMCGPWSTWLKTVYILANVTIWGSYTFISIELLRRWRRGRMRRHVAELVIDKQASPIQLIGWGLFIFLCGQGHMIENVGAFYWPRYDVFTFVHCCTAVVSAFTALTFPAYAERYLQ